LEEYFGEGLPVTVTPYGAPPALVDQPSRRVSGEPLNVIFAGHLAQRKGFAYLIAAMKRLEFPWKLTLAGPRPIRAPEELDAFLADERCTWLGHVPHNTLLEKMCSAHVFVFPSIVEGFGMVLYEAMAAGLPVITTANTAGPDIMIDGREGFIVPIRDPDAIATRLTLLYEDEPRRVEMASEALACANRSGWNSYEENIGALLDRVVF
jgi:glycosyltransferase involved in cell wall biosynthesis